MHCFLDVLYYSFSLTLSILHADKNKSISDKLKAYVKYAYDILAS